MEKQESDNASIRSSIQALRGSSPDEQPPPYSASTSHVARHTQALTSSTPAGLPHIDFAAYTPPGTMLTKDRSCLLVPFRKLEAPRDFLVKQALLPPRPFVHILGSHRGRESHSWGRTVPAQVGDFDLYIDLLPYFVSKTGVDNLNHVVGGPNALARTYEQYVQDREVNKHLILDRRITQWDTGYLAGCIHSLLDEVQYAGNASITFPVTHSRVVIENSDHSPPRSSPQILEKASLRIHDLQTNWCPIATGAAPGPIASAFIEQWWTTWKDTVRHAILSGHRGLVGNEHWMDVAMGAVDLRESDGQWGRDL